MHGKHFTSLSLQLFRYNFEMSSEHRVQFWSCSDASHNNSMF